MTTHTHGLITDKGDPDALALVDGVSFGGKPHYSRQTPGARSFTRNGQNLVFVTRDARATWVTFRPTPGKAERKDGLDAWECALFRNEGGILSSKLIREAVDLSIALWGPWPCDGFITYVKPECVKTGRPGGVVGYCYKRAGWKRVKRADGTYATSSDGKPMFRAPLPRRNYYELSLARQAGEWEWKEGRGGRLREFFEGCVAELEDY
jgi:hypothetical protein